MNLGFSIFVSQEKNVIQSFISGDFDNFHYVSEDFEILFEGAIINKKKLLDSHSVEDLPTLILEQYKNRKENFIDELEGEFRGFIYDKKEDTFFVYTNQTATQRVFHYSDSDIILVDTSLVRLNNILKQKNIKSYPHIQSLYELLAFRVILDNKTAIENIFKIPDGSYLKIDKIKTAIHSYYDLNNGENYAKSKNDAYKEAHEMFSNAIKLEYEKDNELNSEHFSNLSGGLDSRVSLFYAMKHGYKPDRVFCFSEKDYADETISRKIANDLEIPYEIVDFADFDLIKNIDKLTIISEGTCFYLGAIHADYAYTQLVKQDVKLVHTGQIGGAILGTFVKKTSIQENVSSLYTSHLLFSKVENEFLEISKKYSDHSIFMLKNYGFGYTVIGSQVINNFAYQTSGFMNSEFMKLITSLPTDWKYYNRFYIEWINKYCKEATQYQWERTFMKPDATWKTFFGDHIVRRGKNIIYNKILNRGYKFGMVPYKYYFDNRPELQNFYQTYFDDNIWRLENYQELKTDVEFLFTQKDFYQKSQAVNILAIFKLFFN